MGRRDSVTIFITGSELGALKPCGCSGGQLGGLDRRPAILDRVPKESRLVVDTGSLVEGDREQDLIKFRVLTEAFRLLQYDVVRLTETDLGIASTLGLTGDLIAGYQVLADEDSGFPARYTKVLTMGRETLAVTVAAANIESASVDQIRRLFSDTTDGRQFRILLVDSCEPEAVESLLRDAAFLDCVVCPAQGDEPRVFSDPGVRPLVLAPGRHGRTVSALRVTLSTGPPRIAFEAIPVSADLDPNDALTRLYERYQRLVAEANLLEAHPRFPVPRGLKFVGSKTCKRCHEYEYAKWSEKSHAHAYATLEEAGSAQDPECVVCHVVGMDYESGFITAERTPHLKDVGCENCHGPGSEHAETVGEVAPGEPRMTCLSCHTPEHSAEYAGNEGLFLKKIVHWREPDNQRDVE